LKVGPYWHIFPTYSEAKNAVWLDPQMLFHIIPKYMITGRNESELRVQFTNGSYLQLMGADNPDRLRGAGPLGAVLDEYDTMKEDVWPILQPVFRQNGGFAWFVGTPKGRQKLYDLKNLALSGNPEWGVWLLKASESGIISNEQLSNARATMPNALYGQEFECDFLQSEGGVFRGVRDAMDSAPKPPEHGHLYVCGVDLAKVTDYTVIVVYDRRDNKQVYQERIQTLEWPFQKQKIKAISVHFNNALVVLDATGLGDPIADDLIREKVPVQPFKITEISKKELIEKLSIWIEQKKLHMISTEESLLEFDNFSYEISSSGKIRYNAREGYHDDIIIAHALAAWELYDIPRGKPIAEPSRVRKELIKRLGSYTIDSDEIREECYDAV